LIVSDAFFIIVEQELLFPRLDLHEELAMLTKLPRLKLCQRLKAIQM